MSILTLKNKPVSTIISFIRAYPRIITSLQIVLASCFLGICAQIKIPLYFTPVPLTVQTAGVMFIGALLGSRKGSLAALCYLIQGWVGLPVWTGGASGFLYFMGPTGGYLTAYVVQAYLVGWLFERQNAPSLTKINGILLLSICVQLGLGSLWLAQFVGIKNCFMLGFYPFIPAEVVKACFVASYVKLIRNK